MIEWIVSSCVLILAVILVRTVFRKKLRAWVRYSLWALVLVRLLIPFTIGSSLLSTGNVVEEVKQQPAIQSITDRLTKPNISYEQAYDQAVQDFLQSGQTVTPEQPVPDYTTPNYQPQTPLELHTQHILEKATPAVKLETVLLWVWISGMGITAGCFLFSNFKLQRYLKKNRVALEYDPVKLRIYTCQGLDTPCLFGLFRPAVYLLPGETAEETVKQHILCHELTHYRHLDHIWSALRCLCLVLHWYNPLVWVAAILSRRDAELACDEATIRKLGEDQRHSYGKTLIEMTCARRPGAGLMNTATTMTGSKAAIKERVTMIVKKQKLSIVALILTLAIAVLAVGCAFSGTKQTANIQEVQLSAEQKAEIEKGWAEYLSDKNFKAALTFCDLENKQDGIRYYGTYKLSEDGPENHIFFIPCTDSDVPSQYSPDGIRFTHRAPFVLVEYTAMDLGGKVFHHFGRISPNAYAILPNALELHKAYEKELYGSVLKKIEIPNDPSGLTETENTMLAFTGIRQNMIRPDKKYNDVFLGKYDGYLTVMFRSGTHAAMIMETEIGEYTFCYGSSFSLLAIKDGAFYNLKDLYEDGNISEESVAEIEAKYYEFFPEWRNFVPGTDVGVLPSEPSTSPTNPPIEDPLQPFTPVLPNMADIAFTDLSYANTKTIKDALKNKELFRFFLQPYYDRPENFPLYSLLAQYPVGEMLSTEAEFQAMVTASNGILGTSPTYSSYVNKVWIVSGSQLRYAVKRYLGISIEQLVTPNTGTNIILYSENTDSYYCVLNENTPADNQYELWDAIMDNNVLLLHLYDRANGARRNAVLYANGNRWCLYANRPFLGSHPSHPTDPNLPIQTPMVVYQGIRYEFNMEYSLNWLLHDLKEAATVVMEDNRSIPTQELHAAQLSAGTKLYSTKDNGLTLYAVRPDGRVYRLERAAEYAPTLENEPLAYFQKLFRDDRWMNLIGIQEFQHPSEFPINYLCATPLPNSAPITQDERKYLEDLWGHKIETEIQRMPADILQEAVQKYLGLNWDQIAADKLPAYNPATNCYYSNYNGAEGLWESFTVTSVTVNNDTIQVVLELADYWINVATLQITEDGYRFISVETK